MNFLNFNPVVDHDFMRAIRELPKRRGSEVIGISHMKVLIDLKFK